MMPQVTDKVFWVAGLGRSGCAAGALLRRHGAKVIGIDDAVEEAVVSRWDREGLTELAPRAFSELATGGDWPSTAPEAVIISPGIPTSHPQLTRLEGGVPIWGEMELASRFCRADIVAITGTNGKSTTTSWIAHLAGKAGREAHALGNLGTPLSQVADELDEQAVVSLEVSSFQLETVQEFKPRIGLVLNLAPDHLDRYPNLAAYYQAKETLAHQVDPQGTFITWTGCPEALDWKARAPRMLFGNKDNGADVFYQDEKLCLRREDQIVALLSRQDLALPSPPNYLNALAATAAGAALGLPVEALVEGLRDFPGLAHRHQLVARKGKVQFINDTKATNVHAVCAGLKGYPSPVVLIAGGSGKGEDYAPLKEVMEAVRHVVLIGQEGPAIGAALSAIVPTSQAADMDAAVAQALQAAEACEDMGANVLLSPACASFDMFTNYRQRGDAFLEAALACGAVAIGSNDQQTPGGKEK